MREAPVGVSTAHTTPFRESAARMVVGLRVTRPLRRPASEIVAARWVCGMSLLGGKETVWMVLVLRVAFATTTWNVSGVVSVMPRVSSPGVNWWRRFGVGFGENGLMSQRSGDVVVVNRMEPQARTARFSNQVPFGAS